MEITRIKIKRLSDNALIPNKAHSNDAGFDLYCANDTPIEILPHQTQMISTGWAIEIPDGYFGGIYARSGLASKQGLRPSNCVGVIDSGYRGEIMVALHNDSNETRAVHPLDKIAQLIIHRIENFTLIPVQNLSETERNSGGFGSTGN